MKLSVIAFLGFVTFQVTSAFSSVRDIGLVSCRSYEGRALRSLRHSLQMATKASSVSSTPNDSSNDALSFLGNLFRQDKKTGKTQEKPKIPNVVVDSDYKLSYLFALIGFIIVLTNPDKSCSTESVSICPPSLFGTIAAGVHVFLASFFAIQAKRIRFLFDETAFELRNVDLNASTDEVLKPSGENIVVGGANRWDYDKFVNWDFFPSVDFPILVYFKETQTPKELWDKAAGQYDKRNNGQIHFFPAIANCKQLEEQFKIRGCAKVPKEA